MSKLSEYSKFDHIDESVVDESESPPALKPSELPLQPQPLASPLVPAKIGATRKTNEGRYIFEVDGREIYEWEQSLEEVNIYIKAPPGVRASQIICDMRHNRLRIGLRGSDRYFIDEETFGGVMTEESSWYLDDGGILNIVLVKSHRGETWDGALKGRDRMGAVDPFTRQQMQKDLMLQRFQEENPGFDFRGAEFNGEAPDPRTFMGGVKYD